MVTTWDVDADEAIVGEAKPADEAIVGEAKPADEAIVGEAKPADVAEHLGALGTPSDPPAIPAPSRDRRLRTTLLVLAAVGCMGWSAVADVNPALQPAPPVTASQSADDSAMAWIQANVPLGAHLLTDGPIPPSGYPAAPATGQDVDGFDYFVTSAGALPAEGAPAAKAWRSSVPVAVFDGLQVRRILVPTDPTPQAPEADRADRLLAGTALLSNPDIAASPDAQAVLAAGELDLRAATLLAALAAHLEVRLDAIDVVAAEAAAGTPARSITVYTTDPEQLNGVLSGLAASYRPDRVAPAGDGITRLHWPLSFDPSRR